MKNKFFVFIVIVAIIFLFFGAFLIFQNNESNINKGGKDKVLDYTLLFEISSECQENNVEKWEKDVLIIKEIEEKQDCSIKINGETVINPILDSNKTGYLEISKEKGVVFSGGVLLFGRLDLEILGIPSYFPTPFIVSGSRAEAVTHSEEKIIVKNILSGDFFGTENDEFVSFKVKPLEKVIDIIFPYSQFSGSGNITNWETIGEGETQYEVGVIYNEGDFFVKLNEEDLFKEPLLVLPDLPTIVFSSDVSGSYSIFHSGLIEFEEDMLIFFSNQDENSQRFYIAAGCKAEYVDLFGEKIILDGIPESVTCSIVRDGEKIIELTPLLGETGYLEVSGDGDIINSRGTIK